MADKDKENTSSFASDTSNRTKKEWAVALVVLVIGLVIAHLGVSLFILANIGSDPFTVFVQGLSGKLNLSVGQTHVIILTVLLVLQVVTTKGYIKPGSVVCAFCGGPIIDFGIWIFGQFINEGTPVALRYIVFIAGCAILGFGLSIVVNSNAGTGPNDLVSIILADKLPKIQFRYVRMAVDFTWVVVGFILGGKIGTGTVIGILTVGPFTQFFLPLTKKVIGDI